MPTWILSIALTSLMIGFGLFAPWRKSSMEGRPLDRWIILQGALVFTAIWLSLSVEFPILAWLFWIGDTNHIFNDTSTYLAAVVALAHTWLVMARITWGRATQFYAQIHWWCPIILLLFLSTTWTYEWSRDIEGTDPTEAAEAMLRRMKFAENDHLVEGPHPDSDPIPSCKTFWIMRAEEPRGLITVCRTGWFWWRVGSTEGISSSAKDLQRAKEWLQNPGDRDRAWPLLEELARKHPDTKPAREAEELLKKRHPK